ncbi:hypothetical protein Tco_1071905, partial [Tanacetum coccineum]
MADGESMVLDPVGMKTNRGYEFQKVYSVTSRNEFRKRFSKIRIKEIECHEGLDFEEFGALHEGTALQNLDQFCHVSYEQDDRRFTSQAWN